MKAYIYALSDPRDGRVRYVGKTNNPKRRFESHIYDMHGANPRKENWIKGLLRLDLKPDMSILEECADGEWEYRERHWIAEYRKQHDDLTNLTDGGDSPLDSISFRNQRISGFAERLHLKTRTCYICGGITVAKSGFCKHCLRELSHNGKDEWIKLFFHQEGYRGKIKIIPFSLLSKEDYKRVFYQMEYNKDNFI